MKSLKLLYTLIALIMVLGLLPLGAITVFAEESEAVSTQADEPVTVTNGERSLSISKTHFDVGEPITVTATGSGTDWVGVFRANSADSIAWDNISTIGSGVSFELRSLSKQGAGYNEEFASLPEGRYIIRLVPNNLSDISTTACYIIITVGNPDIVEGDSSLMYVENNTFAPGEKIMVSGKGSGKDWIGIYKINNHNTTHNNLWKYITNVGEDTLFDIGAGGSLTEGDYILCLIKNDASKPVNASAWAIITIAENAPTDPDEGGNTTPDEGGDTDPDEGGSTNPDGGEIIVPEGMTLYTSENGQKLILKTEYDVSEPVFVYATGVNTKDWVGITERGNTDAAIRWQYIDGSLGGAGQGEGFDLRNAPNVGGAYTNTELASLPVGEYTVHLVQNDGYIKNGASVLAIDITITDGDDDNTGDDNTGGDNTGGDTEETELLTLEKTVFKVGEAIMVTAISSDNTDWVGIFDTNGNYLKWHYVPSSLSGVPYDVTQGATIPAGTYTIRLIPKDGAKSTPPLASIEIVITDDVLEGPTSATYDIENAESGYAKGTVTVTVPKSQTSDRSIVMFWADENGKLDDYTSLARFKVTGETTSFTFTDSMVIPNGATRLLVYTQITSLGMLSDGYVSIDLPQGSDIKEEAPLTTFFIISDIHIGKNGSAENFRKMLNEAITLNPNGTAIFIVGDMADNGTEAQFAEMMSIHASVMESAGKDASDYPLFLTLGNHDYPAMTGTFLNYATLPDGTHPTDTSYDFWLNGYHYIFLGSDSNSGLYANLTEETLAWLDTKLNECRDASRPTFVFLHQPMYNTVSGSLPGENWNGVMNEEALRAVLSKYPEAMMFNGHTHWTMDSIGNIFEGTEELPIHIFNCASVSYLWSGYNTITGESLSGSQGYYIEMYDGRIFVRGRDFINGKWISSAQYSVILPDSESDGHSYYEYSASYENGFTSSGNVVYKCSVCGESIEISAPALFTCLGYSAPENGRDGIAVGYTINNEAIALYEKATGHTLKYGAFAASKNKLNGNSIFDNEGNTANGVVVAEISSYDFISFDLIIVGFASEHKDLELAMGAYVIETDKEGLASYSYLQSGTPVENEKYAFITYNQIITNNEMLQ